jgi:hypothetical protein
MVYGTLLDQNQNNYFIFDCWLDRNIKLTLVANLDEGSNPSISTSVCQMVVRHLANLPKFIGDDVGFDS